MSFNKKILAVAIVGGLFSTSAFASHSTLNFNNAESFKVADELIFPATIDMTPNSTDISYSPNYNFGNNEERYVGIKCTGATFNAPDAPSFTDTDASGSTATFGLVNGGGSSSLFYTITSGSSLPGPADERITATDTIEQEFDNLTITNPSGTASCTAALYSNPTDASAPGTTAGAISGTVKTTSIGIETGLEFVVSGQQEQTATVNFAPVYSMFLDGSATALLTSLVWGENPGDQKDYDSSDIELSDMVTTGTAIKVSGNFTDAEGNIYDNANCTGLLFSATYNTGRTVATFTTDTAASTGTDYLCYTRTTAGAQIPTGSYTATYDVVPNTGYDTTDRGPFAAGSIVRDGAELQATLTQQPTGWQSKIAVANDNAFAVAYSLRVLLEGGNTATTIAGGTLQPGLNMINVSGLVSNFSGGPRATVILSVGANSNTIQGMYQLVEPTKGAINNAQMVRPGTN